MPYATTDDGVKLYYEEVGSGTPIVFVHEFAADHRSWEAQMRFFGQRHRCITYGARGYPPSDIPEKPTSYSQNRATDDILAVMKHLELDKAHVVGLSMGGFASLHFGLRHPAHALSLVVAGVGYGAETRPAGQVPGRGRGGGEVAAERRHAGVRREVRLRPDARAVREQGPARLRPVQEGAGRAFGAGLGQHPDRLPGPAARRSTTWSRACAR